jgi:hypothetical protein
MNDRQRQTEFLRKCLLYDDSSECHTLAERIRQLQDKERCVRRAVCLMILLGALAFAGLGYLAVFLEDFPRNLPGFMTRFVTQTCCVLALSSLICIAAFMGLEVVYRKELDKRREQCRCLATKLLEARLGKPNTMSRPRLATEPEVIEAVVSSSDHKPMQRASVGQQMNAA